MWETLFDPSMLDSGKEIAIWCPKEEGVAELFEMLASRGIAWRGGASLTDYPNRWVDYRENTVYFLRRIFAKFVVTYGDTSCTSDDNVIFCVFVPECCCGAASVEVGDLI